MMQRQPTHDSSVLAAAKVVHFVGIGGIGMSALAELMLRRGKRVTGSDIKSSPLVERLTALGARVNVGHSAAAVAGADLVVTTAAARPDNPELVESRRRGIPTIKRAELLGWLMDEGYGVAIAGTHGKTTTTAMVAFLLHRAGLDPTALIGGEPLDFETHGLLGRSSYLVAEADEFDRSFLWLWPKVAIVTSVEADHLDCYRDLSDIARAFTEFASRVPPDGLLVTQADDPVLRKMQVAVPRQSYGYSSSADWRLLEVEPVVPFGTRFCFSAPSGSVHEVTLRLSGQHYALDALAAIAAAAHVGVEPERAAAIVADFSGTRRRFEMLGDVAGVTIVDDYAHHPTAARATLKAARERHRGRIWCVFQPHTSNRTEKLLGEFARAFADADRVLLLPVYHPAGREEGEGTSSGDLLSRMRHPGARCVAGLAEAAAVLESEVTGGDLVITMGAGDVYKVGHHVLCRLRKKVASSSGK